MIPSTLDHAVTVTTERGWHCFPCREDKRPATPNGFKDATNDPAALRELFRRYPGPLVGITTGAASDIAVLDIDQKGGGPAWWAANRQNLPDTRTIRTRSGGLHLYFRHRHGLRCSASQIAPGIDVRADGGYIIAWDTNPRRLLRDVELPAWPDCLTEALRPPPRPSAPVPVCVNRQTLAGLIRFVSSAPEGERNRRLFWASARAGEAVKEGVLSEPSAEVLLACAARETGLPGREIAGTIASGLRHGMGGANHAG
jgi:Bifunctional DNA primase/polymerase, N-terminal